MQVFGADRDLELIRKLFAGEFGSVRDRYDNVVVEGVFAPKDNTLDAVLGYYVTQPRLRLYPMHDFDYSLTLEEAKTRALGYKLDDKVTPEQRAVLSVMIPGWPNTPGALESFWAAKEQEFEALGLPICFFSFMTDAQGGHSVVFCYPKHLVPGDTLLTAQEGIQSSYQWLN